LRIFYDTEFIESGPNHPLDLISIGMVAEDGREYYAVSNSFSMERLVRNPWLVENVWPSLPKIHGDARNRIATRTVLGAQRAEHRILTDLFDWNAPEVKARAVIAREIADFVLGADREHTRTLPYVELWADYGAYDHVALCQLWGTMAGLPEGMPMFTHDLRQEIARLGLKETDLPQQASGRHDALADARHNLAIATYLDHIAARKATSK